MYPSKSAVEKDDYCQALAFKIDRITLSLTEGNPDNLGRLAWSGFIEEIEKACTKFINEKNNKYDQKICALRAQIYDAKRREYVLLNLPLLTTAQQLELCSITEELLEKEAILNSYVFDLDHAKLIRNRSGTFRQAAPGFLLDGLPQVIHTKTFNEAYPITFGYISNCCDKREWTDLFDGAELMKDSSDKFASMEAIRTAALFGGPRLTDEENKIRLDAVKTQNSRATLKTISSSFESQRWSTCGEANKHKWCCMPNTKRTPDIAVCVLLDKPKSSLMYPVFMGEIRGEKSESNPEDILYEGYNASLQTLAFSPRGYYWDIHVWESHLYKLQRNPKNGSIKISRKAYHIMERNTQGEYVGLTHLIEDFSRLFFDALINLRPIAHHAASTLYKANYREFLTHGLKGGRKQTVHLHYWHIFKLRFKGQDDERPPEKRHTDCEDPEAPHVPSITVDNRPARVGDRQEDSIPVTEETFDYDNVSDGVKTGFPLPPNRAERSNDGDLPEPGLGVKGAANVTLQTTLQYLNMFLQKISKGELSVLESTFEQIS